MGLSFFEMGLQQFETDGRLGPRVRRGKGLRLFSTKITRHQGSTIVMIAFLSALDAFTLQLVAALVMLLTLVSATALWQMAPRETFSRYWAMGLGLICVGLVIGSLREEMNANLVIVLGNTLVAMGGALVVNGVACYCEQERGYWPVAGIGAVIFVSFCFLTLLYPNLHLRVVLMSLLFGAICLRMAWLLWTASSGLNARILAVLLLLQASYYGLTASTVLLPESAQEYMDAPAAYNMVYLNAIGIFVLLLLGFTGLIGRRLRQSLEHAAHHDALTGALNRHALDQIVRRELSGPDTGACLSVVVFDLDHFKQLNDTYGHQVGDQALRRFAEAVRANLRQGDELGRTGGEEFCLILPQTDAVTAYRVAERVRRVVEGIRLPELADVRLSVSAGVATAPVNQLVWADLLKAADDALYQAKREGRNRVIATVEASPVMGAA